MKSRLLPTVDTPRDFYLGGVYAFTLFVLIGMLFFQLLKGLDRMHNYALQKRTAVTVSLVTIPLSTAKQTPVRMPVPKTERTAASKVEEAAGPVEDISSLFSEVSTQKIVHKKKPVQQKKVDAKRIAALQKRIKSTKKRVTSATAERVKNLSLVRPSQSGGGSKASGGAEVNDYFAKIQAVIYDNFFPPANTEGSVSLVRVWISASGKLTRFKVLRRSGEHSFDQEVDRLGQRLRQAAFERNPKGNEAVLDVSLVSKE